MANGKCNTCKCALISGNCTPFVFKRQLGYCHSCFNERRRKKNEDPVYAAKTNLHRRERRKNDETHRLRVNASDKRTPTAEAERAFFRRHKIRKSVFNQNLLKQEGKCSICQILLDSSFDRKSLSRACQDHDHKTQKLRDILCNRCNCLLGFAQDNEETLARAIEYLKRHSDDSMIQVVQST